MLGITDLVLSFLSDRGGCDDIEVICPQLPPASPSLEVKQDHMTLQEVIAHVQLVLICSKHGGSPLTGPASLTESLGGVPGARWGSGCLRIAGGQA